MVRTSSQTSRAIRIYPSSGGEVDGEVYPRTGGPFGYNGAFWYARIAVKF
jgi:iron complex outermembrane receptor protein